MGDLDKLNKELYSREEPESLKMRKKSLDMVNVDVEKREELKEEAEETVKDIKKIRRERLQKIVKWTGVSLALLILAAGAAGGTLWFRVRQTVTQEQMKIAIVAPEAVTAGRGVEYEVNYANDSHVDWQDVEVVFEMPEGFTLSEADERLEERGRELFLGVGDLKAGETQSFKVTGQLLGSQDATVLVSARMTITPVNFPSGRFDKQALHTASIAATPLDVGVELADEARTGERLVATITVNNNATDELKDAYLRLSVPPGMELVTADPEFTEGFSVLDSAWFLGDLGPLASVTRQAVLVVAGSPGDKRVLDVDVGLREDGELYMQREAQATVNLTSSELLIEQQFNGGTNVAVVRTGEKVNGVVKYQNVGTGALRDVVIATQLEGLAFNEATLKTPKGGYDPATKTITWNAASVPELAVLQPQAEGQLEFEFTVLTADKFPTDDEGKNQNIIATATIDSPDLPVPTGEADKSVADRFVMAVASDIILATDAFYDDGRLGINSAGPLPPKVGEETTFTVRIRFGSAINDIGEVEVMAVLPEDVRYTDETFKTSGEVIFNERTGELLWTLPLVAGTTARALPAEELHFQVAVRPGEQVRGRAVRLVRELKASGMDVFADVELTQDLNNLPTTETAAPGQGKVE